MKHTLIKALLLECKTVGMSNENFFLTCTYNKTLVANVLAHNFNIKRGSGDSWRDVLSISYH